MTKKLFPRSIVLVALLASGGAAFAQAGPGSAPAGTPAGAAPAAPEAGTASPTAPAPAASPALDIAAARKACSAALNADPKFEAEIVRVADERSQQQRDRDTIDAHNDAYLHIQKNERHVLHAYAGMWVVAAAFVIFLWRRQQALKLEISHLRRDLEAAASEARPAERS
jgi:hypothetical protein